MGKIILLDEATINKIAAGEVIEKPASIVKELVENSIDAGATAITVEITEGGKSYISVSDNGGGITAEDLPHVFERHATSKIRSASDLFSIHTLGFRGEAMSSISAVAEVELQTKTEAEASGSYILIKGGKIIEQKSIGYPVGTSVIVRNLFFNTPARMKFLKSDLSEQGHIADVVEKLALTNTAVSIKLIINGKVVMHTPGNGDLLSVILCIYGKKAAKSMIPLNYGSEVISVQGYIGKPEIAKGNTTFMIFSVNGRTIKNRMLGEAVKQAYKTLLMGNKFPFAIINIDIQTDKIDVNVHPTKLEVKFSDERAIFNTVYLAVKNCLNTSDLFYSSELVSEENRDSGITVLEEKTKEDSYSKGTLYDLLRDTDTKRDDPPIMQKDTKYERETYKAEPAPFTASAASMTVKPAEQQKIIKTDNTMFPTIAIIGQVFSTYILGQNKDTFYLIDQHAAHERIMYEFLMDKFKTGGITIQDLLLPIIVELSPSEGALLSANIPIFQKLGFELEWFGDNTIAVRSIPIIMGEPCSGEFFSDILSSLGDSGKQLEAPEEKIIINLACKNAVKAGAVLGPEEMEELIRKLAAAKLPFTCPHGRPTIITMSQYEIEKKFKRVL